MLTYWNSCILSSFNQAVVAHRTGAEQGDQNAQPRICCAFSAGRHGPLLKSMGKVAVVQREVEKDLFEVALGPIKMRVKRDELLRAPGSWS